MTQARDNSYWLGTATGAAHLTDSGVRYYNKRNGFTDNLIYHTLADSEGNIWLASDGQGIYRFSGAPFTALDESMGLPSAQVMGLAGGRRQPRISRHLRRRTLFFLKQVK